ncbi:acetyl-CoA acetyltransferase [Salinibacillus xinjiangensis]|uniref:Thiolase n=1 Tax=Salinibacillus xinjiangensis TaxID=1229268 RepID=A0A6G1X238_9BACI|nr:acetyl-CoA acetyltransferase [Salinibacillus xinjiangensis]MRG84888.1 thiolase [Salinibacillus xinjiangensis]
MSIKHAAAIVGIGDVELERGKVIGGKSVFQIQAESAKKALDEAGISKQEVDGLFTAGLWGLPGVGQFPSAVMGEYLGIQPKYSDSTQIGGSSFEAHVGHAAAAIQSGLCEVALVVYGSTQRSDEKRLPVKPPELTGQFETPFGLPNPVGGYAMAARRHMHQYGTTSEHLAEIAVATRKWAQLNPQATKRDPLTIDDVLNSQMISDPLHLLDCCLVTDGAGAIVLVSPERAKDCKTQPIWLLGQGESHSHWSIQGMPDLTSLTAAKNAAKVAFEMAGVTHDDIDVVEVYDSFTITALLTIEALGFCRPGEGGDFVANQRTAPGGGFPLNTNGGGLSHAHPGMYGIHLLIEAVRQLRGECGDRQVEDAKLALVNGTGGTLSTASVCILGRE